MLAIPNAEANVCVAVTMYPVMIGAERAEIWLLKLVIPAMVATLPRGAIRDGTVQATGAAADRPPGETPNQKTAAPIVGRGARPRNPQPRVVPIKKPALRTRFPAIPGRN